MASDDNPFSKAEEMLRDLRGATAPKPPSPPSDPSPSFDSQWKYASAFTVLQAAYLWSGEEPKEKYFGGKKPVSLAANLQMLTSAVHMGKLQIIHVAYSNLAMHHDDDLIPRDSLELFAKEIGQLPAFLFDTVLSETERDGSEADSDLDDENLSDQPSFADKGGGRPRLYNWNKIAGLVAFLEGEIGLSEMSDPEIVKKIQEEILKNPAVFCEKGRTKPPDASSIDRKIGKMLDALREIRDAHNIKKIK